MSKSKRKVPVPGAGAWGSPLDKNFPPLSQRVCLENWMAYAGTLPRPQNARWDVLAGKAVEKHFFIVPSPLEGPAEAQHVRVCDA